MSKWRFFKYKPYERHGGWPLLVCNDNAGYLFKPQGNSSNKGPMDSLGYHYINLYNPSDYQEISPLKGIQIIDKNARAKVYKILGIPPIENLEPINLTSEVINPILDTLNKNRAFNGDSAHKFNDEKLQDILYAMTEKNLIKSLDNERYWVEV